MKGSKILVEMGCVGLGLMLTVSMAEITQSYFSWFSRKKLESLTSRNPYRDLLESDHNSTLMGSLGSVGKTTDVTATSLNARGMNGARNFAFTVKKRSVKRGGVDYFWDPTAETAVSTTLRLGRMYNGKNNIGGRMNESGTQERLSLEKPGRYKRNANKQAKDTNEVKRERKDIEDEAKYRRLESAARRKEALEEKAKNIKSRRAQLENRVLSRSHNAGKSGGKKAKTRNNRHLTRKSSIRKNSSKNRSNGASSRNHHESAQKRKLKNESKKKDRTYVKRKLKALEENKNRMRLKNIKSRRAQLKNRVLSRISHSAGKPGRKKAKNRNNRLLMRKSAIRSSKNRSNGASSRNHHKSAQKRKLKNELKKKDRTYVKRKFKALEENKNRMIVKNIKSRRAQLKTRVLSRISHSAGKSGRKEAKTRNNLLLIRKSAKRTHSKAQAWSGIVRKRPMTGGYASAGRLTRASSNLHGAYASAGV